MTKQYARIRTNVSTTAKGFATFDVTVERLVLVDEGTTEQDLSLVGAEVMGLQSALVSRMLTKYPPEQAMQDPLQYKRSEPGS
jgi:hypothetical protein